MKKLKLTTDPPPRPLQPHVMHLRMRVRLHIHQRWWWRGLRVRVQLWVARVRECVWGRELRVDERRVGGLAGGGDGRG
jgi:hypothetical protein